MNGENKEYKKAVDFLTDMIKAGEISAGEKLPTERTLAAQINISRNSTREALRCLENMGIIESRQGSGNYLTGDISKTLSSMIRMMIMLEKFSQNEIYAFRRSMEKTVCFYIIENCDNTDEIVKEANKLFEKAVQNPDEEIETDRRFHYLLIEKTQNRLLVSIMEAITDIYREWIDMVIGKADEDLKKGFLQAHLDIISAIKVKSKAECEKAIDKHYDLIDKALRSRENV